MTRKPLVRNGIFVSERVQGFQKQSLVLAAHTCSRMLASIGCISWPVSAVSLLFNCGIDISIGSGFVFGPPRFPIPSAFPDIIYVKEHVLQVTLSIMPRLNCLLKDKPLLMVFHYTKKIILTR